MDLCLSKPFLLNIDNWFLHDLLKQAGHFDETNVCALIYLFQSKHIDQVDFNTH